MSEPRRVVIVGHGMVGHRVLELLAEHTEYALTVLAEEPQAAYDRVHLSALFSGSSASELSLVPPHFMASWGIELRLNERAVAIDRQARTVTTASGLVCTSSPIP